MAHFEIHSFLTAAHGLLGVISVCLLVFGWGRSDRRVPSGMRPVGYTCFPSYGATGRMKMALAGGSYIGLIGVFRKLGC
jgi:hypothetical protein